MMVGYFRQTTPPALAREIEGGPSTVFVAFFKGVQQKLNIAFGPKSRD